MPKIELDSETLTGQKMQESVKQTVTWIELRIKAGIGDGDSIDSAGDFTDSLGDCGCKAHQSWQPLTTCAQHLHLNVDSPERAPLSHELSRLLMVVSRLRNRDMPSATGGAWGGAAPPPVEPLLPSRLNCDFLERPITLWLLERSKLLRSCRDLGEYLAKLATLATL